MNSIPIQAGQEVIQPIRIDAGPDGRPIVEAADHILIREADNKVRTVASQLDIRVGIHLGTFDAEVSRLVRNENLRLPKHEDLRNRLCKKLESFLQSNSQLARLLSTPRGNVPVQLDDPEIRVRWHNYLFSGRELIDEVGRCLHICAGLDDRLNGLNPEKLAGLRNKVGQAESHGHEASPKLASILEQEGFLTEFIAARNTEKVGATILEFPWSNPDGIPSGGKICVVGTDGIRREFEMVSWFNASSRDLIKFVETALG